jgi:hypothetical protein
VDNDTILCKEDFTEYKGASNLPVMVNSAVTAVSSTLASILPTSASTSTTNTTSPTDAEIQQQLLIEQQIEEERRNREEEYDYLIRNLTLQARSSVGD